MSFNQSCPSSTGNFGNYYDIAGKQTNTTVQGDVNVQEINVFNQHSNIHDALLSGLRKKLNPSEFDGGNRPECLENTRRETLQRIYQWVDANGYPNVLLLIGAAGTGKSTIATTVAGEYQRRGQLGCHMFFLQGRSHPGDVLQTIAYSLAVYNQSIAESLSEKLRNSGDIGPSSLKTKFEILLRDPLSAVATKTSSPILIVLDALDECGAPETRRSLMNDLRDGLPGLPSNFRFVITSRPEKDILTFTSLPSLKVQALNLDHRMGENRHDVFTYIKHELEVLRSLGSLDVPQGWPWDESIQSLANIADGLFIWASTAINLISGEQLDQFVSLIDLVKNGKILDLNELYGTILENALRWDEKVKETFVGVFSFILFGKSPLSDKSINGILGINTAPSVLSYLRSLVVYEPGNPITVRHASFYDYLVSCEGRPWCIDPEVQRTYIASKCFERMGDLLKHNICDIPSSFALNADVPDIDNRVTTCIPPFLTYICCNWVHHLQDVPYSPYLHCQLRSFVYNQLLFWFEVLSLTNTFNDHAGPSLLFAIEWVGNNDPELSSFLRDAYRQASTYSEPISKCVLQIYTSLLPLTKEESPMSIHYAKYANSAFRVEYMGRKIPNDCIKTIQTKWEYVSTCSFSPDGTRILSNSGRVVCVWDATSGELITGPLKAKDDKSYPLSAAYSPDGRYIVVAGRNGIIRKWDVLANCLVWKRVMSNFRIDMREAESAAFSPDRKSVAFGDLRGTIRVWNVETGEQDGESLEGQTDYVKCLSFSPDGKSLVSGSRDGSTIIWDMDEREARAGPLRRHAGEVIAIEFSPCGTNVASGLLNGTILVWNALTGKVLHEIICESPLYSVTYSPNGNVILASGWEWMSMWKATAAPKPWGFRWMSKRNVVNTKAASKVFQIRAYKFVRQVSFSPDGSRFVSRGDDVIQIWDASWSTEETQLAFEEQGEITSISLSSSGKFLASGSSDGSIYLWHMLNCENVKRLSLSGDITSVAFSPFNEQLIAFASYRTVQVWDVTKDKPVTIGNHTDQVTSVAFSPSDRNLVASGSEDNTICIWDVKRRELAVDPLTGHIDHVLSIAYSPIGTRLVSASDDNTVRIWDSETGQLLSILNGHSGSVHSVAYSFDGSRIVSGSRDKTILVWDAHRGQIVCGPITGHEGGVSSVRFSPDGKRILSGSSDNTARVWNAATGQPLFPSFSGHTQPITSVCFLPERRHFATGSSDGTIKMWTLDAAPNDTNWELRGDNWLVGKNGKLMMWIPEHLHIHLWRRRNIGILGRSFLIKLHFGTK